MKKELISRAKELREKCYSCKKCDIGKIEKLDDYDPHVYAIGNVCSKIFFIAEAPGYDETVLRKPLVGRSGKLFDKYVLGGLELKREDVWITNCVLCRPPDNRKPTDEERRNCLEHLEKQFEFIKPKFVVVMGASPMATMLDIYSGITKLCGEMRKSEKFGVDVFILAHPSYYLRTGKYSELEKNVGILKEKLKGING